MAVILSRILPEDLVIDILACLPVKSLKRFRCISKAWCDLIENPSFIATHNLKQTTLKTTDNVFLRYTITERGEPMLFSFKVVGDDDGFSLIDDAAYIPFPYEHSYTLICGSCNGILCLCNFKCGMEDFALWNPATRESKILPSSGLEPPNSINKNSREYGFGFDYKTNDYKVLSFTRYDSCAYSIIVQAELYSLKRDSWKVIPLMDMDAAPWFNYYHKTYKDGVYYWWVGKRGDGSQWILSFNMVDEVFDKVRLPADYGRVKLLTFFNGNLSLVLGRDEGMEKYFDIWVMTQYGVPESLVRELSIGPITGVERLVGFLKNSRMFFNDEKGQLVCYNLDTKQKKCLRFFGRSGYCLRVINYVESLVPINNGE